MCFRDSILLCCKKNIKVSRFFLPSIVVCGVVILDDIRNYFYMPILFFYISFILFWNFPSLMYFTTSKPLYYEDFFIDPNKIPDQEVSQIIKKKYLRITDLCMMILNSILISILSDFWLYQTHGIENTIQIIGVTGGLLKLLQDINTGISGIVMQIIHKIMLYENKKHTVKKKIIEMLKRNREFNHSRRKRKYSGEYENEIEQDIYSMSHPVTSKEKTIQKLSTSPILSFVQNEKNIIFMKPLGDTK